ncbi:MAG: YfiR/HmsC family protein [Bacteroidota bacterium]
MIKKVKYFLLFYLAVHFNCSHAQNENSSPQIDADARVKAHFIYSFTKFIRWENQGEIKLFQIAVLGNDSAIYAELQRKVETKTVQGIPFLIKNFKTISGISTNVQMIYVHKKTGYDIKRVLEKIRGTNTLLISEDYPFKSSMINFVQIQNFQKFEINKELIEEEGFVVHQTLLDDAINSTEEWQNLYYTKEIQLKSERKKVEKQKEEISHMQVERERQREEIAMANKEIERQKEEIKKQEKGIRKLIAANEGQRKILEDQLDVLDKQGKEIHEQKYSIGYQKTILDEQKNEIDEQEEKIAKQKKVLNKQLLQIESQQLLLYMSIAVLLLIAGFGASIYRGYQIKKKINAQLEGKNIAINRQKEEIETQKKILENKNEAITSSINYAKRIQEAILTSKEYLDKVMHEYFVFYLPKDIVSGDFYWAYETKNEKVIFATVDCTGHGVPGAFMSIIGNVLLNEIVIKNNTEEADEILNLLRRGTIKSLKQTGERDESRDGMDISLCVWHKKNNLLDFSGAHNPLYHVRNGSLTEYKGDLQDIGYQRGEEKPFTKQSLKLQKNDMIYLFSDGFVDQKGGQKGKKFYYRPFKELLNSIHNKPLNEQLSIIKQTYYDWKGNRAQIDDICIFGVRF